METLLFIFVVTGLTVVVGWELTGRWRRERRWHRQRQREHAVYDARKPG